MHSEMRPWGDLVPDVLELIIHRLTLADRLSTYCVCKKWSSVVHAVPPHNGLKYGFPCHAAISQDGKTCTLVDPFGNKMPMKCVNLPSDCFILYSKDGWLLVLSGRSIFFFNPLSMTRIDLPDLNSTDFVPDFPRVFALSAAPTSPDCMVISIPIINRSSESVLLCRRGSQEWTEMEDDLDEEANDSLFEMFSVNPVFYHGSFYCLGDDGRLGVFDPSKNVWTVVTNPKPRQELCAKAKYVYMTEFDGELLTVSTHKFGNWVHILKLDPLTNQWTKINTIGDRSLFIGRMSTICSKTVTIGNRMYFPRIKDGAYMFYSCEEHKFYPSGNFYGSQLFELSIWVDPVWFQPSSPGEQLLKWS